MSETVESEARCEDCSHPANQHGLSRIGTLSYCERDDCPCLEYSVGPGLLAGFTGRVERF